MNIFIDKNIGISSLTRVHWMRSKCGKFHWCRKAIAIMGSFNMPAKYLSKTSPFEPNFQDNYIEGKGRTREEARASMAQEEKTMADSLWAV